MNLKNLNLKLVKLPPDIDMLLFLIQEELKSTRLFNGLAQAGLHDGSYQPHLGPLILATAGFPHRPDELYEFYLTLLNKRSEKITDDSESITRQAFKVYVELMMMKKSLKLDV